MIGINFGKVKWNIVLRLSDKGLFEIETIEGGHEGAWLHVGPIDRDALEREMFYVTIIAYKYGDNDVEGNSSFETPANIVIIINDVNDQKPLPLEKDGIYSIRIMEETAMTLNLENFGFHDRDLVSFLCIITLLIDLNTHN